MKAKLVIEMPKNCDNCSFQGITYDDYEPCCLAHKASKIFDIEEFDYEIGKPEWCPLEEVKE
jgi:hypothetical protein